MVLHIGSKENGKTGFTYMEHHSIEWCPHIGSKENGPDWLLPICGHHSIEWCPHIGSKENGKTMV